MANFTPLEQAISEALDEWAMRSQGVVLAQKNPILLMQILRSKELELVKLGDLQKVRHEHKVITDEVMQAYRELLAAKSRLELIQTQKENILKEESKPRPKKKIVEEDKTNEQN